MKRRESLKGLVVAPLALLGLKSTKAESEDSMIKLGEPVKCKYSGFVGIAMARTEYLNGVPRIQVRPKVQSDGKRADEAWFDEGDLVKASVGDLQ